MKKYFIALSILAVLFSACSNNQTNDNNTHVHDDGSVHENHSQDTLVKQEEFTAPTDSTVINTEPAHEHTHDGHEHPHTH